MLIHVQKQNLSSEIIFWISFKKVKCTRTRCTNSFRNKPERENITVKLMHSNIKRTTGKFMEWTAYFLYREHNARSNLGIFGLTWYMLFHRASFIQILTKIIRSKLSSLSHFGYFAELKDKKNNA